MAKSYLGYVKRGDEAFVDWASIGKTLSDDLIQISEERKRKRQDIDDKTRETLVAAEKMQQNLPPTSSDYFMDGASNIREALLLAEKQMKAGLLDPNEYLKKRQNIMDGVNLLADAAQQDRDLYAKAMERLQNGEAGALEQFKNEMLDKYRDPASTAIFVDPLGYSVVIAEKDKDGNVIADPSKYMGIAAMTAQSKDQINKYDVPAEVSKRVKVLGDYTRSIRAGGVMALKDIMQRKEYVQAENDIIASMMTSPRNVGGILTDYLDYTFTVDPKEAASDPKKILVEQDSSGLYQPKPTEEQRKAAAEAVRAQLRVQLDRAETPMPIRQPTDTSIKSSQTRQNNLAHLELIRKIYSGTKNEAGVAADAIRALNPNINEIEKKEGSLTIRFADGRVEQLEIPQVGTGSSGGFEQFATRAGAFLIPDLAIEQTFIDWKDSPYSSRSQTYKQDGFESAGGFDPKARTNRILAEANFSEASFGLTEEGALPQVKKLLEELGGEYVTYTAEEAGFGTDQIRITAPDGTSILLEFDYEDEKQQIGELAKLKTFLEKQVPIVEAAKKKAEAASTTVTGELD